MNTTFVHVLGALYEGTTGLVELRALPSKSRTFTAPDNVTAMRQFVAEHKAENLYFGVATRKNEANGTAENCLYLPALFTDLDFRNIPEPDARHRLATFSLPPSLVIHSGGGLHPYWTLKEAIDLTIPDEKALAGALLRRLARDLGGDRAAAEVARILRIPGTKNHKYQPARAVVVETYEPEREYNSSEFDALLSAEPNQDVRSVILKPGDGIIREGGRNAHLTSLAGSMRRRGMTPEAITVGLQEENRRSCDPPLEQREVDAIATSVARYAPAVPDSPACPAPEFTLTSIGDLLAEPEEVLDWLVEDRIPAGGMALMAAKPKVGKSTAARALALAVARGDSWLGHRCETGMSWYLALEGRRRDVRAHFRQMGAQPDDPLRVFVGQAPKDVVSAVRQLAEEERPALIVIDTMQRFLRAQSTDDYAEMTTLLDAVIGIAQRSGAAMLLLHHSGKADRASLDAVLGSTAITGSVDTVILLTRSDKYRTISTVQRVGDDLEETVILLDEATGHVRLGQSRHQADETLVADAILAALQNAAGPLTEPEFDALVDARTALKRRALRQLVAAEQVSRTGRGGKGDPYRYAVSCSRSLVPSKSREQENNHPDLPDRLVKITQDSCSHVRVQDSCSRNEGDHAGDVYQA